MTIGEVGQFFTGAAALWAALNSVRNSRKLDEVHKNVDGKMDKLLKLTGDASFAAGQKDEKEKGDG
jgi:hypothetical protein